MGTKNNFVSDKRPTSITRCFCDLLIRRVLPTTTTFRRTCLAFCRRAFSEKSFQRKWGPQNHRNSISGIVFPYKLIYLLRMQQFHTHFTQIDDINRSSGNIHGKGYTEIFPDNLACQPPNNRCLF